MEQQRRFSDDSHAFSPNALNGLGASDQACNECKRRKGKCDRVLPECTPCARNRRHCLYEKSSRSPLTRKYLTEVEERLRRSDLRLRQVERRAQLAETALRSVQPTLAPASSGNNNSRISVHSSPSVLVESVTARQASSESNHQSAHGKLPGEENFATVKLQDEGAGELALALIASHSSGHASGPASLNHESHPTSRTARSASLGSIDQTILHTYEGDLTGPALPYEVPPSETDDFSWDEQSPRDTSNNDAYLVQSIKSEDDSVADGMASLAVEDRSSGYLGIASGAAMLRLLLPDAEHKSDSRSRNSLLHASGRSRYTPDLWEDLQGIDIDLDAAINAYFGLYHLSYPIVHEPTFRAQYAQVIARPAGRTWNALALMVAAVGLYTVATTPTTDDMKLFEAAKANLSMDTLESGNISLVQVLTLMSNYLQKRNKPNSGYVYLGLALHTAMALGLHKEFRNWKVAPLTTEIRRRVWWTLYVFYVGALITFGRPISWPENGVEAALPLNIWDRDLTAASPTLPPIREHVTGYTASIYQAKFHLATVGIYSRVISTRFPSATELLELDQKCLGGWLASLGPWYTEHAAIPPRFAQSHCILFNRLRNFRIIMYRPFVIRKALKSNGQGEASMKPDEERAVKICLEEARATIDSIQKYWTTKSRNRLAAWYALYFVFQASLIPCVCLRNSPSSSYAPGWKAQVLQSLSVINDMDVLSQRSQECAAVIMRLCGAYLGDGVYQQHLQLQLQQQQRQQQLHQAREHLHSHLYQQHSLNQHQQIHQLPPHDQTQHQEGQVQQSIDLIPTDQQQQQSLESQDALLLAHLQATEESPQTQLYQVYPMMWPGASSSHSVHAAGTDAMMQDLAWTNFLDDGATLGSQPDTWEDGGGGAGDSWHG